MIIRRLLLVFVVALLSVNSSFAVPVDNIKEQVKLAINFQSQGRHHDVVKTLQPLLKDIDELENSKLEEYDLAMVAGMLGLSHTYLGNSEQAEELLDISISIAENKGFKDLIAVSTINKANLTLLQRKAVETSSGVTRLGIRNSGYSKGIVSKEHRLTLKGVSSDYLRAAKISGETKQWATKTKAYIYAAKVAIELGVDELANVRYLLRKAIETLKKLSASNEKSFLIISIADVFLELIYIENVLPVKDVSTLHALLLQSLKISEDNEDSRLSSYALSFMAQLYMRTSQYGEALALTRRAIMKSEISESRDIAFKWYAQLAEIYVAQRKYKKAANAYNTSKTIIDEVRHSLPQYDPISGRSLFRETVGPIYMAYSDLLLKLAAADESKEFYLEKVRSLIESLKTAEIAQYFKDECVTNLLSTNVKVESATHDAVILYPIIMNQRLELIASTSSGLKRFTTHVSSTKLRQTVVAYRNALLNPDSNSYLPLSQRLYKWLIKPIESYVVNKSTTTLVFIPDGVLRTIPISALHDGKSFLVEKISLATTVGLDLLDNRTVDMEQPKALLLGLSEDKKEPLPNVVVELERIQALHGGDKLLNNQFTEENMSKHLESDAYSIVHIATHAQFSSKVEQSYLLAFNGERIDIGELESHISKTQLTGKPIELLTLSACETAVGNDKAALGLAGVAIKAGARSVFASLWKIRDESTAVLVEEFYRNIQGRKNSKSSALRKAQLKLLNDKVAGQDFSHPYYWAPFILLGNWKWS